MRKLGTLIFVLVLLLLVGSLFFFSSGMNGTESTSPSDYVRIDTLRLCETTPSLSANLQKIRICGSIVSDKQSIPIRMYLYKMPNKNLVAENQVDDRFAPGEFVREFDLPNGNSSGSYKFVAYFYKEIIGELEFEIQSP